MHLNLTPPSFVSGTKIMHYADSIHQADNSLQGGYLLIPPVNVRLDFADDILYLKGEEQTTQRISIQHLQHPRMHATHTKLLDSTNTVFVSGLSGNAIQSPIQGTHDQDGERIIAVIESLINASEDNWEKLCKEFSWLTHYKTDPPEELFPGDTFLNQLFRSMQYRIVAEVKPEFAPKILEICDKETKPYEPRSSYLRSRLMLATQALRYNQVQLPAKKLMGYLKEIIDIKNTDKEVWKSYFNSMEELRENNIDESNFFSFLFSCIYMRTYINAYFLNDLIDVLDELQPKTRELLLADFEDDNIESRLLIDGVWWTEANLESPNWNKCLQVFDRTIEKTVEWGYPHIASASARGKSIIHDEYLNTPDTAHEVLKDMIAKVGTLPAIEEAQAVVYFNQKRYKDALNIYERILPKWNPPSEQVNIGPLEEYRRAAICAANLDDWKKAATFFEDGTNKTQKVENTERYISLYVDAGFAHFKSGNMLNCIKLLYLALKNFERLPQDNTDVKYFTLKKRLEYTIKWIWIIWCGIENNASELSEPAVGFCSNPETNEKVLDFPDSPIGYSWLFLAQIEYRFGHGMMVLDYALQITDRNTHPVITVSLIFLEIQHAFKNKIFNNLPQHIQQLADVYESIQKHHQTLKKIDLSSAPDLSNFTSGENFTFIFVSALLVQLPIVTDIAGTLSMWRANSSELPIKDNIFIALDLIESILSGNQNNALTVMKTQESKGQKRLVAALKLVESKETNPENLFLAHTFITTSLIDTPWEDFVAIGLAELLSAQWLEKIKFRAALKMPMVTVPKIEQACKSSETGKKKIGQILLAVHPAVSARVAPEILQEFRSWTESDQKHTVRKNPAAQRLIKAMEKPPHLTDEDIEALNQSIKEGEIPIKFDSPFDSDESNK